MPVVLVEAERGWSESKSESAGIRRGLLNYTEAREPLVTDTWLSSMQTEERCGVSRRQPVRAGGLASLSLKLGFRADARKTALKHRERLSRFADDRVCSGQRLAVVGPALASLAANACLEFSIPLSCAAYRCLRFIETRNVDANPTCPLSQIRIFTPLTFSPRAWYAFCQRRLLLLHSSRHEHGKIWVCLVRRSKQVTQVYTRV